MRNSLLTYKSLPRLETVIQTLARDAISPKRKKYGNVIAHCTPRGETLNLHRGNVRLSERGWKCVRLGRRLRSEIDARLVSAVGKPAYPRTRLTLLKCLEVLGGLESIRGRRIREPP